MKNRMAGIILIVTGALLLGIGTFVYSIGNKNSAVEKSIKIENEMVKDQSTSTSEIYPNGLVQTDNISDLPTEVDVKENELEKMIKMAIADGILTANKRELIKQEAIDKGEDYVKVIGNLEKRIKLLENVSSSDTVDINEKNGIDFEKFIVQKFDRKFFKIKEWTGDKYVNGIYAESTQHPDLLMEFVGLKQNMKFAVECKWRQRINGNGIAFSTKNQLNRYRDYAKEKNIPVFIAIGLGGKGTDPEKLYIVPLQEISKPFILLTGLQKYEKDVDFNFFFDHMKIELR